MWMFDLCAYGVHTSMCHPIFLLFSYFLSVWTGSSFCSCPSSVVCFVKVFVLVDARYRYNKGANNRPYDGLYLGNQKTVLLYVYNDTTRYIPVRIQHGEESTTSPPAPKATGVLLSWAIKVEKVKEIQVLKLAEPFNRKKLGPKKGKPRGAVHPIYWKTTKSYGQPEISQMPGNFPNAWKLPAKSKVCDSPRPYSME